MCQTYRRVCSVDALTTVSRCTEYIEFAVIHIQMEVDFFCFRHDCNGTGGSMDTSAGFCFRNSLYTVHTTLIFQTGICSLSLNHKSNFLKSTDSVLIETHHLSLPTARFCVFHIHTINFCCKQCRFISAGTGTDLNDNVLAVIRVLRKKKNLQFCFQLFHSLLCIGKFFLQHLAHFFILFFFKHRYAVLNGFFIFFVFFVGIYDRLQLALFFHQLLEAFLIVCHTRFSELIQNFLEANKQIL